jgi:hypothetical protein
LRRDEKKSWEEKSPYASVFSTRRIWAEGGANYGEWDNRVIDGEGTESLEDVVHEALGGIRT